MNQYPEPIVNLRNLIQQLPSGNTTVELDEEGWMIKIGGIPFCTIHANDFVYCGYSIASHLASVMQQDQSVLSADYPDNKRTYLMTAIYFSLDRYTESEFTLMNPDGSTNLPMIDLDVMAGRARAIIKSGHSARSFLNLSEKEQNKCLPNHFQV